ncbi:hypothetical protein [Mongoliibacter ruber]|uniref:Uncharacterized protein n=1 Tax=Mongoliibacter ruber TaxID=1750599 RepID=A0A2T0WNB4_9BACT|nr:hypothetical protein [Mongoliibacter ruber]PRY88180.1 hypothetical protein CLW00_105302 [Mongoliibacter ruber]
MYLRIGFTGLFLVVLMTLAKAQGKFFVEISGGASDSFLNYRNSALEPAHQSYTKLSWNGGLKGFYDLGNDLEVGVQLDFVKRNHWRTFGANTSSAFSFLGDNVFQTGLMVRKTYLNPNQRGLYWQTGLSMIFPPEPYNPVSLEGTVDGLETGLIKSRLGLGLNGELGYRLFNLRENYFIIGLRYQQGLYQMEQLNIPIFGNDGRPAVHQVRSYGSFASAFVGYGINTSNWNKYNRKTPKRYFNENKRIKNELANLDGFYLMAYGGFRIKEPITPKQDIYFNSSGQFSTVIGYKWKNYSFETGYGQFSAGNNVSLDYGSYHPFWTDWVVYGINTPFVPLTFKYDIPISDLKTVRFGPSFSSYFLLKNNTNQNEFIYRNINGAMIFEDGSRIDVSGVVTTLPIEVRKHMFFNAGMHLEFQVFNSSFMSLNLFRNFGSPVISRFEADYQVDGTNIKFEQDATLNGFRFDFGWKLPLNILDNQKKQAMKN